MTTLAESHSQQTYRRHMMSYSMMSTVTRTVTNCK
jgi:hypothetical protein